MDKTGMDRRKKEKKRNPVNLDTKGNLFRD